MYHSSRARPVTNNSLKEILFASTMFPRYLSRFWLGIISCYNFNRYIDLQFQFTNKLNEDNKKQLVIRPFMEDYGWDYKERWANKYPDIKINSSGSFADTLNKCKIFVCDNIQTVWLESLFVNKPTVMYLDFSKYFFTDEVTHYLNQLKSVSILHDSPEMAAQTVNNVSPDVETWWNNSTLQRFRKEFCDNYVRKSTSVKKDWFNEMNSFYN